MKPITEEDLIAYQMGECSWWRAWQVRRALERDPMLAEEAVAIGETLRAFSGGPAPAVDEAMLDRSWQRVRPSLAVLEPQRGMSPRKVWAIAAGSAVAGAMAVLVLAGKVERRAPENPVARVIAPAQTDRGSVITPTAGEAAQEIQQLREAPLATSRTTPVHTATFTTRPVAETESGLAGHLDAAVRVLTEVSHEDGPLPAETHREVHRLLMDNAVYQQEARMNGDASTVAVMDDLGRALTSLDADPPKTASGADAFRLEFNVGGVLFDLRVLEHDRKERNE
jgi:hypothetical protein